MNATEQVRQALAEKLLELQSRASGETAIREVFIPLDLPPDAAPDQIRQEMLQRVSWLPFLEQGEVQQIQQERESLLLEKGVVREDEFPDRQRQLQQVIEQYAPQVQPLLQAIHQSYEQGSSPPEEAEKSTCEVAYSPHRIAVAVDNLEIRLGQQAGEDGIFLDGEQLRGVQKLTLHLEVKKSPRVEIECITLKTKEAS